MTFSKPYQQSWPFFFVTPQLLSSVIARFIRATQGATLSNSQTAVILSLVW